MRKDGRCILHLPSFCGYIRVCPGIAASVQVARNGVVSHTEVVAGVEVSL